MTETFPGDDYVLGANDAEIARLGCQHRVWLAHTLSAWRRAGLQAGDVVIDLGAGPGYASLELAHRVGPAGRVMALERSLHFVETLKAAAARADLANIDAVRGDAAEHRFEPGKADFLWCRWLLCFVQTPKTVIANAARALKPGGIAVFHEYAAYETWRMLPPSVALTRLVQLVMQSWRDAGGEPDIAAFLPGLLERHGLHVVQTRPVIDAMGPRDFAWRWLAGFIAASLDRLTELGQLAPDEGPSLRRDLDRDLAQPGARMIGPMVLEIIARK